MFKKALLIAASIFLIFQSIGLWNTTQNMEIDSWGAAALMAALFNLFVTGIFAFAGFALPTQKLMPQAYYTIHNPKRLKKAYKTLGIESFRQFLLATFWKSKEQRAKYFNGKIDGIDNLERQSKKSEFGHLIPLIILTLLSIYFMMNGNFKLGILTLIINIIFNFYTIPLQRYHRMRIGILRRRMSKH